MEISSCDLAFQIVSVICAPNHLRIDLKGFLGVTNEQNCIVHMDDALSPAKLILVEDSPIHSSVLFALSFSVTGD